MKKIYSISILINVLILSVFFYNFNASFKKKEVIPKEEVIKYEDKTIKEEEYIKGVVACEMPASFNLEALKAQAIAARTYLYNELSQDQTKTLTDDDQCYIDDNQMKSKWGSDYNKYKDIITEAVNSTKDIVMNKNNKLFKSFYFSTSNGYTESSMEVFNEVSSDSVESSFDKETKGYEVKTTFTKDQLTNILGPFNTLEVTSRNKTNHVTSIYVDSKVYTGIEFRKLLGLRSTDFKITKDNNNYIITTYGYGHGVGMSQYGANYLASIGYSAEQILKYYYQEIKLVSINK